MPRVYNFCAGPAALPEEVLQQARDEMLDYQGSGMSIMESSHRGKEYAAVHEEAMANMRTLLGLSDDYHVLFLQGGASQQFALVPMNLLREGETADYTNSGSWAAKAIKEARLVGNVNIAADTSKDMPTRMPAADALDLTDGAAYLHITTNETISGAQWKSFPAVDTPLVADMSSDILSRPIDASPFGLIYAGAQKNLGPAGVAVVVIRNDMVDRAPESLPTMFRYKTHVEKDSLFNTPPCFAVYIVMLVTRWLMQRGPETIYAQNVAKAARLYNMIDGSDFYTGTAAPEFRSDMNVTFRLARQDLEPVFIEEAEKHDMKGLKGHRSVGGLRASIYNAFPVEGVDALVSFMQDFESRHG